jgi:hypothetical protein
MKQKNEVLTREVSRIPLISATRTTTREDYPTMTEIEIAVNTTEQTRIFEVGEKARAGRTTPKLGSFLVEIIKWLYYLGSGKIDDRYLQSRQHIHDNPRIKGIGL